MQVSVVQPGGSFDKYLSLLSSASLFLCLSSASLSLLPPFIASHLLRERRVTMLKQMKEESGAPVVDEKKDEKMKLGYVDRLLAAIRLSPSEK